MDPYDQVVETIRAYFMQRNHDALNKATKQLNEWGQSVLKMRCRGEHLEASALSKRMLTISDLIKENAGKFTPRNEGPTPELVSKPSARDSIKSLEESERINPDQVRAAREIQFIVEAITRCVQPRCQKMQRGNFGYKPGSFLREDIAIKWSQEYKPWRKKLSRMPNKKRERICQLVVIDGISLDNARKDCSVAWSTALLLLREGLDLWLALKNDHAKPSCVEQSCHASSDLSP